MHMNKPSLFVWVTIIGLAASASVAQDVRRGRRDRNRDPGGQATQRTERGERGGERGAWGQRPERGERGPGAQPGQREGARDGRNPREGRRWGGPPREITPEDRERFYDRMIERQMERFSRNYELDDQQQQQVRAKLEDLRVEQRTFTEQHWPEFQSMREEMRQAREQRRPPDPQRREEMRQRFESLRSQSPLFNTDRVAGEIEQMLPAEQAERGRARRQAEQAEREQRRQQFREQFEQRRGEWEQRREEWRQRRERGEGFGRRAGPADTVEGQPEAITGGDDDDSRHERRGEGGGPAESASPTAQTMAGQSTGGIPENPIGPWEQYVREFIQRYQLDPAQQATAQSVLREVLKRRVSYEQSHRLDFAAARKITNSSERDGRLAELNKPVVSMFDELKRRLNHIPSSAQRQRAGIRPTATSRPARTLRTDPPTTRPAGQGNRRPVNRGGRGPGARNSGPAAEQSD